MIPLLRVLDIRQQGDTYIFQLSKLGDMLGAAAPMQWVVPIGVQSALVDDLSREIRRITEQAARKTYSSSQAHDELRGHCQTLFNMFARQRDFHDIAEELSKGGPLLISTAECDVPWELMHDGQQFLCLSNSVGRQLRTAERPAPQAPRREPSRCLLVSNPTEDEVLRDTEEQAETLIGWLAERNIRCEHLSGKAATRVKVITKLDSGNFDLFHYCGHVDLIAHDATAQPNEYALRLADGSLRGNELRVAGEGIGIAFINGCRSAQSVESVTGAFLRAGARLVIGTIARVGASESRVFAEHLYGLMLQGNFAGEAFRQARLLGMAQCGVAAWAPFVLYGFPLLQVFGAPLPEKLRRSWSASGRRVIEQAVALSATMGSVSTPSVLAALLSGENRRLRDALAKQRQLIEQGLTPKVFQAMLEDKLGGGDVDANASTATLNVSENTEKILDEAERLAGSSPIDERHLQDAFVLTGGGSIGEALREAGLDWAQLTADMALSVAPDEIVVVEPQAPSLSGFLEHDFTPDAFVITRGAAARAQRRKDSIVRTLDLFAALVGDERGCAARELESAGFPLRELGLILDQFVDGLNVDVAGDPTAAELAPSSNLKSILREALHGAAVEQRKASDRDLWRAFARHDGGNSGPALREALGIDLRLFAADIIDEAGNLRLDAFDPSALEVLHIARSAAENEGEKGITTVRLVVGLCALPEGAAAQALAAQGVTADQFAAALGITTGLDELTAGDRPDSFPIAIFSRRAQRILALSQSVAKGEGRPAASNRDLLVAFLNEGGGLTAEVLKALGVNLELLSATPEVAQAARARKAKITPALDKIGRDLVAEARAGKLRPVVDREDELDSIEEILLGATDNGVLLLGDSGVGKTAIVEGFAQRIADGKVAPVLGDVGVVELRASALVASTTYRGDFEARIESISREAQRSGVILFIDEFHTLLGAGASNGSALDAANILKPYLARGEIRCIGATTLQEYRRHVEPDAALSRRFQKLAIKEASLEQTAHILRELRSRCERDHGVEVPDATVDALVRLSRRYLAGSMPGKACNLLDKSCVKARLRHSRHGDPKTPPKLTEADILGVIQQFVPGLRLGEITAGEQQLLQGLEEDLARRVIGQPEAVAGAAKAVRLARLGLRSPDRPLGVFLFVGLSGVGKTELAKALSHRLFGSEETLVRLDMSEFAEPHTVSRLLGSPPGYVSHQEGGQLTSALQRQPHCVMLFDEIEKAHSDVVNVLLRLFDEGAVTDSRGLKADGRNALFIMTSNVGGNLVTSQTLGFRASASEDADAFGQRLSEHVRKSFPAEFVNRIDDIIVFRPLSRQDLRRIAELRVAEFINQTEQEQGVALTVEPAVLDHLTEAGYQPAYGARALLREVESRLKGPVADRVLAGEHGPLLVSLLDGQIVVEKKPSVAAAESQPASDPGRQGDDGAADAML